MLKSDSECEINSEHFFAVLETSAFSVVEVSQSSLCKNIGFFACFRAISLEHSRFSKIATLFLALVALKLLVSLISRINTITSV